METYTLINLESQKLLTSWGFDGDFRFNTYLTNEATTWSTKQTVETLKNRCRHLDVAIITIK